MNKIKLIECVRSTWQGEGKDVGVRMTLCRQKYCSRVNLCKFCDTIVKMRISEESEYSIEQLQKVLDEEKTGLMITGGEPSADKHFDETVLMLTKLNFPLANVESNGYRLNELIIKVGKVKNINYMYSPKIFTQEDLDNEKKVTLTLKDYPNVYIKLVCENNDLITDYMSWLEKLDINQRVYLMPEGRTKEELLKNSEFVFDMCEDFKFGFTSREHIIYSFI